MSENDKGQPVSDEMRAAAKDFLRAIDEGGELYVRNEDGEITGPYPTVVAEGLADLEEQATGRKHWTTSEPE